MTVCGNRIIADTVRKDKIMTCVLVKKGWFGHKYTCTLENIMWRLGTSLLVYWLRLHPFQYGDGLGSTLVRELKSTFCMAKKWTTTTKKQQKLHGKSRRNCHSQEAPRSHDNWVRCILDGILEKIKDCGENWGSWKEVWIKGKKKRIGTMLSQSKKLPRS